MMKVHVSPNRQEMGQTAAKEIAAAIRAVLHERGELRMVLAAAPSQSEMLAALRREQGIEWKRVTAFHMDEYIGLANGAPQRFAQWLRREFADHLPLRRFEAMQPDTDADAACRRYAAMLAEAPIDLVLLGIGVNGHLAFNDPPADLEDPLAVKVVALDAVCRRQQVEDGCFAQLEDVPRQAMTLTVPALLSARELFCCVPGNSKSAAVRSTLNDPVSGECPSTALRTHPNCTLYLDRDSSAQSRDLLERRLELEQTSGASAGNGGEER